MNAQDLYIGAPVQIETAKGWQKVSIYSLEQYICKIDNITEMSLSDIYPIPLTSEYLSKVEETLGDQDLCCEYSMFGKNWKLWDCTNRTRVIITTIKHEHELEQLFKLLTGNQLTP